MRVVSIPCLPNVTGFGDCPALLRICTRRGAVLAKDFQMLDPDTGLPVDWPPGTSASLKITTGAFTATYPATIVGSVMSFLISGANTAQWPKGACAEILLTYPPLPGPFVWAEGHLDSGCC